MSLDSSYSFGIYADGIVIGISAAHCQTENGATIIIHTSYDCTLHTGEPQGRKHERRHLPELPRRGASHRRRRPHRCRQRRPTPPQDGVPTAHGAVLLQAQPKDR